MHKDFTDFLADKFTKQNPMVLDDEIPDAFNEWLADLDVDTLIEYADQYKADNSQSRELLVLLSAVHPYLNTPGAYLYSERIKQLTK